MARWGTEIGRVDILYEVSNLFQYVASPRKGHMEQLLHIWGWLKKTPKLTIYFDLAQLMMDYGIFHTDKEEFKE